MEIEVNELITPDGRVFDGNEAIVIDCIWGELTRLETEIRRVNDRLEKLIFALATKGG